VLETLHTTSPALTHTLLLLVVLVIVLVRSRWGR
jgi:hypothetical protein